MSIKLEIENRHLFYRQLYFNWVLESLTAGDIFWCEPSCAAQRGPEGAACGTFGAWDAAL